MGATVGAQAQSTNDSFVVVATGQARNAAVTDLGSDDGLTADFMRQVVLDNAQMATGNTPVTDFNLFNGLRALSANINVELPEAVKRGSRVRCRTLRDWFSQAV